MDVRDSGRYQTTMVYHLLFLAMTLTTLSANAQTKKWESAIEYFESDETSNAPVSFKPLQLTDAELREQFLHHKWTSFVVCNGKKMKVSDELGKLTDSFEDEYLTQWRYPRYELRDMDGVKRFRFTSTSYQVRAYVGDGYINALFLYFSGRMNDQLEIQPYTFEPTGELVFLYKDIGIDELKPQCKDAVSIFVQPPLS